MCEVLCQYLGDVTGTLRAAGGAQTAADVHEAAGVIHHHAPGAGGLDVGELARIHMSPNC